MTSSASSVATTGVSTGTWSWLRTVKSSPPPSRPSGPGYVTCHSNCFAMTPIGIDPGGAESRPLMRAQAGALMSPMMTTTTAVTPVQMYSGVAAPCV
jgi:hypothetical protein